MGNGECCYGFGKQVCPFISEKSSMTRDPRIEQHKRRGSRKDPKYSRRILVGETLEPRKEGLGLRADWESIRKRTN